MCGFVAVYNPNAISGSQTSDIEKMSASIRHRGPDLDKKYKNDRFCCAFRRLSIIDLEGGSQPYVSEDDRYVCIYNGEIYNYLELKKELEDEGEVFSTNSEVEVLVRLYSRRGESFISSLRGMFAFIIYDSQTCSLIAARDPFGIKPMYYREDESGIIFASEAKAFLFDSAYKGFGVDKNHLQHFLSFEYVTEPNTISGDIFILPKASYMTVCSDKGKKITKYFDPFFKTDRSSSYISRRNALREAVESSVEYHMLADVPVGTFLSSGVDSAIITALSSRLAPGIKAFTIGFDVKGYSEIEDAKQISAHLNVDHICLHATVEDFTSCYEKTIYHLDSPMADPSVVAIYLISREAAKHVKVILSGEGSDEIFGGYKVYASSRPAAIIGSLPAFLQKFLLSVSNKMPDGAKGKAFLHRGCVPVSERYIGNSNTFTESHKKLILPSYNPDILPTDLTKPIYENTNGFSELQKMQYCDFHTWLPSDILVKGDRLSMAHALEARVPFLDKEVFAAASSLRDRDKLKKGTTKFILRDAFSDILNQETVVRPKLGYPVPVRVWLKNELYDWARDIIKNNPAEQYINTKETLRLLEENRTGKRDLYKYIWTAMTFMTWYRLYVSDAETTKRRVETGEL